VAISVFGSRAVAVMIVALPVALASAWQADVGRGARITTSASSRRSRMPIADQGEMPRLPLVGRPLSTADTKGSSITLSILKSISEVSRKEWDACVRHTTSVRPGGEPFLYFDFLHALESSGSVDPAEGWMVQHLVAHEKTTGELLGAVPLYLKSHSYGEYVFDHAWARSYRSSSSGASSPSGAASYYPKLQACVPFTPVAGARLLVADTDPLARSKMRGILARGLVTLTDRLGLSGVHVTFATSEESQTLRRAGFLPRLGLQYHWHNRNFNTFEDYLRTLKQSRRKAVRQERRKVASAGFTIHRLRGAAIKPWHWEAFYRFYRSTIERKWGHDYLKRSFFDMIGRTMLEHVLLVLAEDSEGELVAGALHLIGNDCVYGRNWGCSQWHNSLHFELCGLSFLALFYPRLHHTYLSCLIASCALRCMAPRRLLSGHRDCH